MLKLNYPHTKEIFFSHFLEEKWPVTSSIINEYSAFREAVRSAVEGEQFDEIREAYSKYIIYVQCLEMFDQKSGTFEIPKVSGILPYPSAVLPTLRTLTYSWSTFLPVDTKVATPLVEYRHGRCDLVYNLYTYAIALVNHCNTLVDGPQMLQDCSLADYGIAFKRLQNAAGIFRFISLLLHPDNGFPTLPVSAAELRHSVASAFADICLANANRVAVRKFISLSLSQQRNFNFRTIARICIDSAFHLASALDSLRLLGPDYTTILPIAFRQYVEHGIVVEESMAYKYLGMHYSDMVRNDFGIAVGCYSGALKLIKSIKKASSISDLIQAQTDLIEDKLRSCQYSVEAMNPSPRIFSDAEVKALLPERSSIVEATPFKMPPGIFQAIQSETQMPSAPFSNSPVENPLLRSSQLPVPPLLSTTMPPSSPSNDGGGDQQPFGQLLPRDQGHVPNPQATMPQQMSPMAVNPLSSPFPPIQGGSNPFQAQQFGEPLPLASSPYSMQPQPPLPPIPSMPQVPSMPQYPVVGQQQEPGMYPSPGLPTYPYNMQQQQLPPPQALKQPDAYPPQGFAGFAKRTVPKKTEDQDYPYDN